MRSFQITIRATRRARGKALMEMSSERLAAAIRAIKADTIALRLQKEFFAKAAHPVDTAQ